MTSASDYKIKTLREQILLRPDTYVGSVQSDVRSQYIPVDLDNLLRLERTKVKYCPALLKVVDELLVNAADNSQRDGTMTKFKVEVTSDYIKVVNNGQPILIEKHETGCYIPEMIFGQLLSGTNYDDDQKKTTGGRNGYGAKLANIYSKRFTVSVVNKSTGQTYLQVFENNMTVTSTPEIKDKKGIKDNEVCVICYPDFTLFEGIDCFTLDFQKLIAMRCVDMAGTLPKSVKVFFNKQQIRLPEFKDYCNLFSEHKCFNITVNDWWNVSLTTQKSDQFCQISFVNNIHTYQGGKHVDHVVQQVIQYVQQVLAKKKVSSKITTSSIKQRLFLFVNSRIVNPTFESQCKNMLTTKKFGSTCVLPAAFLKKFVNKSNLIEDLLALGQYQQTRDIKKSDGAKKQRLSGIPKLDDANWAGTRKSAQCTLILTEGDSAKALAVSGITVVGRDRYGVMPLKGKLLNVRTASLSEFNNNAEISTLKRVIGLKFGEDYKNVDGLRYGNVMIMADQDTDGSHIKGLVLNLFATYWPSLLRLTGFLKEFVTPVIRVFPKGQQPSIDFFSEPAYRQWVKNSVPGSFRYKYYKGLGTSTSADAKQYFSNLDKHVIDFEYTETPEDVFKLPFDKKYTNQRKEWIQKYEESSFINNTNKLTYADFVDKELVLYSVATTVRAIPNVIDGLKECQRKILYACFKRNLQEELKVAQLAGYVSEHTEYHHGEASLMGTIINMAQDYVGSNNINILLPNGQFGTRDRGGKDAASPRYIFTQFNPLVRLIFRPEDDAILRPTVLDGQSVEPEYYYPIIPTVLVNGAVGIACGYSTSIPCFNPLDITKCLIDRLQNPEIQFTDLVPYYQNFRGVIKKTSASCFDVEGVVQQTDADKQVYTVTELPVGMWTSSFKEFLQGLQEKNILDSFSEHHDQVHVCFKLVFKKEFPVPDDLLIFLKLKEKVHTSNMYLFDAQKKLTKYESVKDILTNFFDFRLRVYKQRKQTMIEALSYTLPKLETRKRFVQDVVDGALVLANASKTAVRVRMTELGYSEQVVPFKELLNLPLTSLTHEKVEKLRKDYDRVLREKDELTHTREEDIWLRELGELHQALAVYNNEKNSKKRQIPDNLAKKQTKKQKI